MSKAYSVWVCTLVQQVMVLALVFAFVMVGFSIALSIPIMLFGLSLAESGWTWQHAALFSAMVASTDAVAGEWLAKSDMQLIAMFRSAVVHARVHRSSITLMQRTSTTFAVQACDVQDRLRCGQVQGRFRTCSGDKECNLPNLSLPVE